MDFSLRTAIFNIVLSLVLLSTPVEGRCGDLAKFRRFAVLHGIIHWLASKFCEFL